eukprot:1159600-Pelagomonas_calceolata.AAC.1
MNDYAAGLDWLPSPVSVFDIHGNVLFSNWASTKFAPVSLPQGITAGKLGLVSELDSQLLPVCTWTEKELTPAKGCRCVSGRGKPVNACLHAASRIVCRLCTHTFECCVQLLPTFAAMAVRSGYCPATPS